MSFQGFYARIATYHRLPHVIHPVRRVSLLNEMLKTHFLAYQCQENIGCCPIIPNRGGSLLPPTSISVSLCPDYSPPVGSCNSCPSGYSCNQNLGGCCRQSSDYTALIVCPGGTQGLGPCGNLNQCPDGQGCYKGACCPMVCPRGQTAQGFCNSNSCASGSCQNGCCCSEAPSLPVCSNGRTAVTICIRDDVRI